MNEMLLDEKINKLIQSLLKNIDKSACLCLELSIHTCKGKNRSDEYVLARMLFIHVARRCDITYKDIANYLDVHHSSVIHLYKRFKELEKYDPKNFEIISKALEKIRKYVKNL